MGRPRRRAAAAITASVSGLGFGIPCVVAIRHLAGTGQVWIFLGFPTYGDGPFERAGLSTTVPLLAGFLVVCIAEVGLAVVIQRKPGWATTSSFLLLPVELIYWIGFALPAGPVLGLVRVVLLSPRRAHGFRHGGRIRATRPP